MTLDTFLVSSFLVLNLFVGLWYGRQVTSLRQYAIGHKKFTTKAITASIVATNVGGGFLFYGLENTYTQGLLYIIPILIIPISFWLTARVVVVRMREFLYNLSVAEAMGDLYGKTVQTMTAVGGILSQSGFIAIQFKAISKIFFLVFRLEGHWVTCLTAGILMVYSAFGGIRSVTLTDVLQFIALCVCMPVLLVAVYTSCVDDHQIITKLATHPLFNGEQVLTMVGWNPQFMGFLSFCFLVIFPSHGLDTAQFQRIAMSHSIYQAQRAFTYAAFCNLLLLASVLLLGILLWTHNATLHPKELVDYLVATYSSFPAFKGLLVIGVVALAMSTADSYLNTATVMLVHDIITSFRQKEEKKKERTYDLALARICTFFIGSLALLLALSFHNLCHLKMLANSFTMPTYYIPFLLALFGFRSTPTAVLISMVTGCMTVVLWCTFLAHTGINGMIPGMLANMFALFISHRLLGKPQGKSVGWVVGSDLSTPTD